MPYIATKIIMALAVIAGGPVIGLVFEGFDRIISARMQKRVGPPLLQPFYDIRKLMVKESVIPSGAVKWIFETFPLISLTASILILFYVPLAGNPILGHSGDLVLVVYLFIFPGLALALAALSSNSPYANLGGQRLVINMMGYEFPLAIISLAPVWIMLKNGFSNPFSLSLIYSHNIWQMAGSLGIVGLLIESAVAILIVAGESSKSPFNVDTADSEIAGGALAEYSGRNLAIFHLAEDTKAVAIASLFISLFFPWNSRAIWGLAFLIYLLKLFLMAFLGITLIRTATSRFKISRLTRNYWLYISLFAAIGFLFLL